MTQPAKPRGKGRPRVQEGQETVAVKVRVSEPQRAKFLALGGSEWVRRKIDEAPEPKAG